MCKKEKVLVEINVHEDGYLNIGERRLFPETEKSLMKMFDKTTKLENCESAETARYVLKSVERGDSSQFDLIHEDKLIKFWLFDGKTRLKVPLYICEQQCAEFGIKYEFNKEFYFKHLDC